MTNVSLTSVLSLAFWGNLTFLAIYIMCRIPSIFKKMNCRFMIWMLTITFVRFLFPAEWKYSVSIRGISELFTDTVRFLLIHTIQFFGHTFYLYQMLLILWLSVAAVLLLRMLWKYACFRQDVKALLHSSGTIPVDVPTGFPPSIRIFKCAAVSVPVMTGVFRPVILLPEMDFASNELSLILKHELQHYKYKDVLLKTCIEISCILYWWNPVMRLLRKKLFLLLEIRADSEVYRTLDDSEKIDYLKCLKNMSTYRSTGFSYGIHFAEAGKKSFMLQRMSYLAEDDPFSKPSYFVAILCSVLLLCSVVLIFEPADGAPPDDGSFALSEEYYIIKTQEGIYEMYLNEKYVGEISDPYTDGIDDLAIYKNTKGGEVIRNHAKEKIPPSIFIIPMLFILLFCSCIRPGLWKNT